MIETRVDPVNLHRRRRCLYWGRVALSAASLLIVVYLFTRAFLAMAT